MYLNENHMQSLVDLEAVPMKAFVALNQKLKTQIETTTKSKVSKTL